MAQRAYSTVYLGIMLLVALGMLGGAPLLWAEEDPVATASDLELWSDLAHLKQELAVAVEAVATEEGKPYKQPLQVKITEAEEMGEILEEEVGDLFRRLGSTAEQTTQALKLLSGALVMKYEPSKYTIHVMPKNVARILELLERPELGSREMLRITLIHEAAHGHDFQHYPHLDDQRRGRKTNEGVQAIGAVIEGHAQYVAAKIAKKLGLETAFGQLVELTVAAPPTEDAAAKVLMDVTLAEQRFAYVGGQKFFEAVFAARGEAGVRAVMSDPPGHVRLIERPEAFLNPSAARHEIDSNAVFAPLMTWSTKQERQVSKFPFKRSQLEAVFNMLPAAETAQMRSSFQEGWGVASLIKSQADMVAVVLTEYGTVEGARGYVTNARNLLDKKGEVMKAGAIRVLESTYEDGTGPDGSIHGFICVRKMSVHGTESTLTAHAAQVDRFAFDVTFMDEKIERPVQLQLIGDMAKALNAQLSGAAAQKGDTVTLMELVQAFHAAQKSRDDAVLEQLGAALCPTSAELKALCREGEAATAFLAAYGGPRQERLLTQPGAARGVGSKVFQPGDAARTEIQVHAATTEELVAYAQGSAAYEEFPGGMRRFAKQVAAPGRTWFIVELLEPGKSSGMKYTCFTKVGDRFVVVLKPWRAIPTPDKK